MANRVLVRLGVVGICILGLLSRPGYGQQGPARPVPPAFPPPGPVVPVPVPLPPPPTLDPAVQAVPLPVPESAGPQRMPAGPVVPTALSAPAVTVKDVPANDNPTGRQEPAVSLEWIGPPVAKVGEPISCQIVIKNISPGAVQQVVVRSQLPAGVEVGATEPQATPQGNALVWELGTLEARQEKRLDLQLVAQGKGNLACQTTVTFTGTSTAYLVVREPKLTLKASPPERVTLGDTATVTWTVSNPGDGAAERVKVRAALPPGLEHARGKTVEFDVGNLAPNESRSVQLVCVTRAGGVQNCAAVATADGNLSAEAQASVEVIVPRIDLALAGPHLRYLERPATFVLTVTNPGTAPADNVTVSDQLPQGFKFVSASHGGRYDFASRGVSWFLGNLPPGQSREVTLEVVAANPGEHKQTASAVAARGLKAEAEAVTRVEGLSALLMEMVDLDDPVEVGADTAYEIRVTNTGSKTETNLQLICTLPDKMEFRGARGPGATRHSLQGRDVIFEPVPKLAPRADAIYRVNVRGLAPGDFRFRARIKADGLTVPVLKEESTKVYGDEAVPK